MAFIKAKDLIGKWVTTTKHLKDDDGVFVKGSRVKIVRIDSNSCDIQDSQGNMIFDCTGVFYDPTSISDSELPTFTPTFRYGDKEISFNELRSMTDNDLYRYLDDLTSRAYDNGYYAHSTLIKGDN